MKLIKMWQRNACALLYIINGNMSAGNLSNAFKYNIGTAYFGRIQLFIYNVIKG